MADEVERRTPDAGESQQRTPGTVESTYPFFRHLFGMPYGPSGAAGMPHALVDWVDRMLRTEPFEPLRSALDAELMRVDETVEDGHLVVRADLPGVDPDRDVEITVADGVLRIRAERRQEQRADEERVRRREIRYGSFSRVLPLPEGVTAEDVTAEYRDGVLAVRLPIEPAKAEVTRVAVSRG